MTVLPAMIFLMGMMFLMVVLMTRGLGMGYMCPGCGARDEDSHHKDCGFKDRW